MGDARVVGVVVGLIVVAVGGYFLYQWWREREELPPAPGLGEFSLVNVQLFVE